MEKLPTDIIENILGRLEIKAASRSVCKAWRFLLRGKTDKVGLLVAESSCIPVLNITNCHFYYGYEYDPNHWKMDIDYTNNRIKKMHNGEYVPWGEYLKGMLGSCNGLVCFQRQYQYLGNPFLICNPFTGEVVYIPKPKTKTHTWNSNSGFGYCYSTNKYKIVRMYDHERNFYIHADGQPRKTRVQVYTIGGGKWRNKGSIHISTPLSPTGIYANGALHWLHRGNSIYLKDYVITSFDLETEKFQFIPMSRFDDVNRMHRARLFGGINNLYLVYTTEEPYCTDIWAYKRINTANACNIKENYNDKNLWHWIKEFRIEWEETHWKDVWYFEPMAITRNGELLLRCESNDEKLDRYICCYNLKTSTVEKYPLANGCRHMINITFVVVVARWKTSRIVSKASKIFGCMDVTAQALSSVVGFLEHTSLWTSRK